MKTRILIILMVLPAFAFRGSDKNPFQLYTSSGKKAGYEKMLEELSKADIVLFGELHNSPISHWLELEIAKDLYKIKGTSLSIGCEMFEADNQLAINEYLSGLINDSKLEENTRLWNNYKTDYKAIVQFAKASKLPFIATNVPRRYASMVYSSGLNVLDSLSAEAYFFLPNIPIVYDSTVACYKNIMGQNLGGHSNPNLPKAQALKDATMAHFILKNIRKGGLFYHFNGAYHSNNHEGIVWYLKKMRPDLKIMTVSMVEQENIDKLNPESESLADYIVAGSESFPKSY